MCMARYNHGEDIYEAALLLMADGGYHATSIRDIVNQVGIRESSFYNHFVGKHALLKRIVEDHFLIMDRFYYRTRNDELEDLDPVTYFTVFFEKSMKAWKDERTQKICKIIRDSRGLDPICHEHWKESEYLMKKRFVQDLQRMFSMGKIKPCDIDSYALILLTIYNHYMDKACSNECSWEMDGKTVFNALRSLLSPLRF